MTLKKKSLVISFFITVFLVVAIALVAEKIVIAEFQKIENQRVVRNIRRVSAILDDRFQQMNNKLVDWTNWDDTYKYLQDKNKTYEESNLIEASFKTMGVDEVLFIGKNGELVSSLLSTGVVEEGFPQDLYSHFSIGSALLKIEEGKSFNHGIIRTDDGLLLFVVRGVFKSDGSGGPMGAVVFARYMDAKMLNAVKELTQFEASMVFWDDPEMALDYSLVRKEYMDGKVENIKILNESVISGYFVLNDVYGKPQAIIRTDIDRDVYFQGQRGIYLLVGILALLSVIAGGINYYLVTISVLGKVTKIIEDVDYLAKTGNIKERLDLGSGKDEVDNLRLKINNMLYSLDNSQRQLVTEKMKSESFIDLIDAIVVSLDVHGIVEDMNQKGAEILGYKKEEVIGMNWLESFIPAESKDKVKGIFNDIVGGDLINNAHVDNEVLCKNGEKLMISWHNTYVKGVDGAISGTVSIGEDITDESIEQAKRVEYAKELERLNQLMVGRELKMIEMKKEIEELKKNDGKK